MILALALIPVIILLIIIYVYDKKEKEPIGLLLKLFFGGMATVISALILEGIGTAILDIIMPFESVEKSVILAMIIVGPVEELGKYAVLRLITWKNKQFDYSYDAIVYSVFTSLGFAAIENIGYVFSYGISTAFLRMFSAVPGHACFAVFMGFFYGKAKHADLANSKKNYIKFNTLAILIPVILHGIYDAVIMGGSTSEFFVMQGLSLLLWFVYVIALFIVSCITTIRSSKNDFRIVTLPSGEQAIYRPGIIGSWTCSCGTENNMNFCGNCGNKRPTSTTWYCSKCGALSAYNFCGNCGCPKPQNNAETI